MRRHSEHGANATPRHRKRRTRKREIAEVVAIVGEIVDLLRTANHRFANETDYGESNDEKCAAPLIEGARARPHLPDNYNS
jgi:hypothetical protein